MGDSKTSPAQLKPSEIVSKAGPLTPEQEEIINKFVPKDFFKDSEVDPIRTTLSLLPSADSADFIPAVEARITSESDSLDIISRTLNENLLSHYNEYINSMQQISDLNTQLNSIISNIRNTRQVLLAAESEICDHPRVFFRQIQKQKSLKSVTDLVSAIDSIYHSTDELNSALEKKDFLSAIKLCMKPANLSPDIKKLTGVENLVSSLNNMYARVQEKMEEALVAQTKTFNRDTYANLMAAYDAINKLKNVPQKIQESFMTRSDQNNDRITRRADLTSPAAFQKIFDELIASCVELSTVHQQIVNWHRSTDEFSTIRKTIEDMAKTLLDKSELQLSNMLLRAPVSMLDFDSFDKLLRSTSAFIQFGATVVDLPGEQLTKAMGQLTSKYFKLFHKGTMESIKGFLEFDSWSISQVEPDFVKSILTLSVPIKEKTELNSEKGVKLGTGITAINIQPQSDFELNKTSDSCKKIIHLLHQYITLMKAVPSLSNDTFNGIKEFVEYYSFSTLHLFIRNTPLKPIEMNPSGKIVFNSQNAVLLNPDSAQCLARIVRHFQDGNHVLPTEGKVSPTALDAIVQASVAAEGMKGVAWYLQTVKPVLEECLTAASTASIGRFYSDVILTFLCQFPKYCYQFYGPNLLNLADFESQVKNTRWTSTETRNESHGFTTTWKDLARSFAPNLETSRFNVPLKDEIWSSIWTYTCFVLLNAFSSVSKCSIEGRTAMLSDFKAISHHFSILIGKRFIPDENWVKDFVQAFFMPVDTFKEWAQKNYKRYTTQHIISIVETGLNEGLKRQDKKDLGNIVRSLYRDTSD